MRAVALGLLLAVAAVAQPPPPVEIRAHAEPDSVTIGTRFRYVLEVLSQSDAEVFVTQPGERIGDFDIVDFGVEPPAARDGRTVLRRWWVLVGFSPGEHLVKSPTVTYRVAGGEQTEAPGAAIRVSVESALARAGTVTDIRDIKGPEPVPIDWRPIWLLAGGAVAVLGVAIVLWRLLARSARARPGPPARSPQEVALAELEQLRCRGLVREGAFKEYYSALSGIVRAYVERRFEIRAPEMTTEEFLLASARRGRLQPAHRGLLGDFLTESDLVKFARHLPTIADSERAWAAARRFVEETPAAVPHLVEERRAAG